MIPDHFSRRLDGRAGDMAQLPEPQCSQSYRARMWRRMLLGLAVFWGGVALTAYLIF